MTSHIMSFQIQGQAHRTLHSPTPRPIQYGSAQYAFRRCRQTAADPSWLISEILAAAVAGGAVVTAFSKDQGTAL